MGVGQGGIEGSIPGRRNGRPLEVEVFFIDSWNSRRPVCWIPVKIERTRRAVAPDVRLEAGDR